jgi:hypothetical protein
MKLTEETAKRLYEESQEWFRAKLIEAFGKECFEKESFKCIETFKDACDRLQIAPDSITNENDNPDEAAYKKLKVIIKAINNGWIPDWDNLNQRKWFPWFGLSSGFGFSRSFFDCGRTAASVGSRLCFESEEKSDYAGRQFIGLYKEFLT